MSEESRPAPGDAEILARLRGGDETAFDELVRIHQRHVHRLALRLTGDPDEADDVAQETFLRAYRALREFRGEAALRTWLMRIAANLSLNVVQSARRARRDPVAVEEAAPPDPPRAEAAVIEAERRSLLGPAIEALPPRQRATLLLRVEQGLKFREIARIMGCTTGTAKANFFHAVAALRRALGEAAG
jgi:RNA polymerase sigma-70 factor (ECF subfamily)